MISLYSWNYYGIADRNLDENRQSALNTSVIVFCFERKRADDFPGAFGFTEKLKGREFCPELVGLNSDVWRNCYQLITGTTDGEAL